MRNKYNARRTKDRSGFYHRSAGEAERADELLTMESIGLIADLKQQPRIADLHAGISYTPDFSYTEAGRTVYEDFKGIMGDRFRIVCKLWRKHGPGILRITKRGKHMASRVVREIPGGES